MPSSLMLLSSLGSESGNSSTASRINRYLAKNGLTCHVRDPNCFPTSVELCQFVKHHHIDCILGIHLYKAGYLLKDCNIPCIIIIGGTDVNKYHADNKALDVMTDAANKARYLVVFGASLHKRIEFLWPHIGVDTIVNIKQAVITKTSSFSLPAHLKSKHYINQSTDLTDAIFFLLVAGIRSVKDPLYLTNVMSDWHTENEKVYFIIVGPVLDEVYYEEFMTCIKRLPGVCYIPGLPSADTHAAIQQAFAFINSSKSEGMSLAILEAMQLGTPVLARAIPGNEDIVEHDRTGLLYDSPQDFIKEAKRLVNSKEKRQHITKAAQEYVSKFHSPEKEEKLYLQLINNCIEDNRFI